MWHGEDAPYSCFAVDPFYHLDFKKGQNSAIVEINNLGFTPQLFKVKTTDNDLFDCNPVMGILNLNQTAFINIKYLGKDAPPKADEEEEGVHYVSILNCSVPANIDDPELAWEQVKKTMNPPYEGDHSIIVQFPGWHPDSEEEWSIDTEEEEETTDSVGSSWDEWSYSSSDIDSTATAEDSDERIDQFGWRDHVKIDTECARYKRLDALLTREKSEHSEESMRKRKKKEDKRKAWKLRRQIKRAQKEERELNRKEGETGEEESEIDSDEISDSNSSSFLGSQESEIDSEKIRNGTTKRKLPSADDGMDLLWSKMGSVRKHGSSKMNSVKKEGDSKMSSAKKVGGSKMVEVKTRQKPSAARDMRSKQSNAGTVKKDGGSKMVDVKTRQKPSAARDMRSKQSNAGTVKKDGGSKMVDVKNRQKPSATSDMKSKQSNAGTVKKDGGSKMVDVKNRQKPSATSAMRTKQSQMGSKQSQMGSKKSSKKNSSKKNKGGKKPR